MVTWSATLRICDRSLLYSPWRPSPAWLSGCGAAVAACGGHADRSPIGAFGTGLRARTVMLWPHQSPTRSRPLARVWASWGLSRSFVDRVTPLSVRASGSGKGSTRATGTVDTRQHRAVPSSDLLGLKQGHVRAVRGFSDHVRPVRGVLRAEDCAARGSYGGSEGSTRGTGRVDTR